MPSFMRSTTSSMMYSGTKNHFSATIVIPKRSLTAMLCRAASKPRWMRSSGVVRFMLQSSHVARIPTAAIRKWDRAWRLRYGSPNGLLVGCQQVTHGLALCAKHDDICAVDKSIDRQQLSSERHCHWSRQPEHCRPGSVQKPLRHRRQDRFDTQHAMSNVFQNVYCAPAANRDAADWSR